MPKWMPWSVLLSVVLGGAAHAQEQASPPPLPQVPAVPVVFEQAQQKPAPDQLAAPTRVLVLTIGGSQRVQMTSKKKITDANNPQPRVARIAPIEGDPASVLITGMEAGVARITLIDEDKRTEVFEVTVQLDIEYLKTIITRAVPTASVTPIPSTGNSIILTGTVARAEDVDVILRTAAGIVGGPERLVNAMHVGGVMQVQLDVVVAQVSREEIRRMSFDFFDRGRYSIFASTVGGGFVLPSSGISGTLGAPVITNSIGTPNGAQANFFLGVFSPANQFFGLLQALRDENVVKLMAEPKVISLSGRPASFLSGGEQAIPVPAGLGQVGVQFEEFGTRLNFLPIVLGNGKIHLEVEPEVSALNAAFGTSINGTVVPGRTTQRVHTNVELEDGQTFVLGGLIQHIVTANTSKVPVLGDLPFVGVAFRRIFHDETDTELVIVVTVHLIDPMACDQAPKVFPGQETRSPDDFELFLEGILEAPRGPRNVFSDHRYVPAYKNSPTAAVYPCAGADGRGSIPGCKVPGGPGCSVPSSPVPGVPDLKPAPKGIVSVEPAAPVGTAPSPTDTPKTLPPAVMPVSGEDQ